MLTLKNHMINSFKHLKQCIGSLVCITRAYSEDGDPDYNRANWKPGFLSANGLFDEIIRSGRLLVDGTPKQLLRKAEGFKF